MALQAQDLMSMFSDTTRQNKFHYLFVELNIWESHNKDNPISSRAKLEGALREINEQPMDEMDWTPNAVSLQELQPGSENVQENSQETVEYYVDEMELD